MTDWEVLKHLDLARLASIMRSPVMIDLRRIYPPEEAAKQGFIVETIGRSGSEPHPINTYAPTFLAPDIAAGTHKSTALSVYRKHGNLIENISRKEQLPAQLIERKDDDRQVA
jgi:hypothetical protein